MTSKEVPHIGAGFQAFIDHLFWYLPFPSIKQGNSLLGELQDLTEDNWSIKREENRDEHKLDSTPNDLIVGWKAWIRGHRPNKGGMPRGSSVQQMMGSLARPLCMTSELP